MCPGLVGQSSGLSEDRRSAEPGAMGMGTGLRPHGEQGPSCTTGVEKHNFTGSPAKLGAAFCQIACNFMMHHQGQTPTFLQHSLNPARSHAPSSVQLISR